MVQFKFDKEKSISILLYIIQQLERADFIHIFKVLYFAEQKHLVRYGRPIVGDSYIAMKRGPVPSSIYDELTYIRKGTANIFDKFPGQKIKFSTFFDIKDEMLVINKAVPDLEVISESEMSCLDESLRENKDLSIIELSNKSHDMAWSKANQNDEMNILDIAEAGGASPSMLEYILEITENQNVSFA
jgi:uncharacterized phage-associated protein